MFRADTTTVFSNQYDGPISFLPRISFNAPEGYILLIGCGDERI